jgi:hypothetical protein
MVYLLNQAVNCHSIKLYAIVENKQYEFFHCRTLCGDCKKECVVQMFIGKSVQQVVM